MHSLTTSLTDPPAQSPIADGILWVQSAALGSTATAIAILAIAAIGLLMMAGRVEIRRGITVVIGCFILFGASSISTVLASLGASKERNGPSETAQIEPAKTLLHAPMSPRPVYDPYAGASVPSQR